MVHRGIVSCNRIGAKAFCYNSATPIILVGLMSGEQFYINYSLNGEHYAMGPYHTRRFAMSHIDDIRRQPGVSNVYLSNKPPDDKSYRKLVPITIAAMGPR